MKRILVVLACAAVGSCSFSSALETYCKNRQEDTAVERCDGENSCCSGFQCVSGLCCAQAGTVCSSTGQCCEGLTCSGGRCVGPEEPDAGFDGGEETGDGGLDGLTPAQAEARMNVVKVETMGGPPARPAP